MSNLHPRAFAGVSIAAKRMTRSNDPVSDALNRRTDERNAARRWAVELEQECAYLREQIAGALAVAEQLGCTCEFMPNNADPCDYCTLRAFLTLPPDGLVLDVIDSSTVLLGAHL